MSMPARHISSAPTLAELLRGIAAAPPLVINGIATDSRRLQQGGVFLALQGMQSHGLDHVDDALLQKASAIVWEQSAGREVAARPGTVYVPVHDLGLRMGEIANRWFDTPSASLSVTGVTGTNGKTTVAWLMAQSLQALGVHCGYIGTLGAGIDNVEPGTGLTTPDCVEMHRQLAAFRADGAACAAIEVSSHGLQQRRVDGVHFDTAIFTNLSRDHIDYHGDMTVYGEIKASLFLEHAPRTSIVCIDGDFGRDLLARIGGDAIAVATTAKCDAVRHPFLHVVDIEARHKGTRIRLRSSWGDGECVLPLYGDFNVANAAVVMASLCHGGTKLDDVLELMATMGAPPGRLQRVAADTGPQVFVDYAHTPAALEAALGALRPHCSGKLWCVFGCGGDRDRGKRPLMGQVVERLADCPVLTSDNPRTEDPLAIIDEVRTGMTAETVAITDRAVAIAWAIGQADDEDIVLIAGKGHEDYQIIGRQRINFSDYRVAEANLRLRDGARP